MTEFGTLEIVTDPEAKGQEAEPKSQKLDPPPSHSPTPPPEGQSQVASATAPANPNKPGSSQGNRSSATLHFCLEKQYHTLGCFVGTVSF